ncbi:hypothetical protein [Sanguibacter inulinus]|uniref:Uncharacterized protein n=1 Tax=Sanguibacter inulinus TaxID=60922 RepID=A0A853EXN2_9MICO|nr:hypothetical protein [Sanguibacter inulinus]MBF0724066.1 hypothetical protein [Sanguibacter inulinus]NYS95211.1 hypothetical protein [Sanguibacter inulinus]
MGDENQPRWVNQLVSSLAVAIGDEEIRYMAIGEDLEVEGRFTGYVVAFTDSVVVKARSWGATTKETDAPLDEGVHVRAIPARRLSAMDIDATGDWSLTDREWPRLKKVTLFFGDEEVTLPLPGRLLDSGGRNELFEFVEMIRARWNGVVTA